MSSPVVNVARYTALIGGIGYGIVHRRTLQKREDTRAEQAAKRHEEKIQADKKREQEQSILAAVRSGGNGVVSDPDSPQFDLEKYLKSLEK
ncbi:uncharacterized protein FA14DRAFT_178600 [Meira miltonrushii]|uniref:ATP synthase F(0) complex subunit e, mitochondrial n=1 Tax=Meira miltonrushii TaxID=1280837 RepID=A0A316VD31_9BASI|nr:uncharacterized protein FA14DRAFT_178600 [Meira miltonrushii]PWN35224.1 hypothetical protein FA14DRAFT_178600 [Meira miltonrushii]